MVIRPNQLNLKPHDVKAIVILSNMRTPFEQAVEQARLGQLQTPKVLMGSKNMDYFAYQLAVHKYNLGIMAMGMTCRGIKFTDIKKYYGLKGRSAKDCQADMIAVMEMYKSSLTIN